MSPARHKKIALRIATYNIHKCRGMDGRTDIGRVANVLKRLRADVIVLQEVIGPSLKKAGQEEELALRLRMTHCLAPARMYRGHHYGNAVLSRLPLVNRASHDLSIPGHEPRLCQRADIEVDGHPVHIYNIHLGTSGEERRQQARKLISYIAGEELHGPKIVIGDFNEWRKGPATDYLNHKLKGIDLMPHLKWRRTYPGILPIFHIDHIYFEGNLEIMHLHVPRGLMALMASDHLPMAADLLITVR